MHGKVKTPLLRGAITTLCSVEDRGVMETSLRCCQASEGQALGEHGRLLLVFRQEMNDPPSKLRRLGMGDNHCVVMSGDGLMVRPYPPINKYH